MPGNILNTDLEKALFPEKKQFGDSARSPMRTEAAAPNVAELVNSLYILLEQIRWTLQNLGIENFSEIGLDELRGAVTGGTYRATQKEQGRTDAEICATNIYLSGNVYINGTLIEQSSI